MLFELISAERRSIMITANQPFGEWNRVFPDPAMTLAAVDRLVHHTTIFAMNVQRYRRRSAIEAKRQRGRPPSRQSETQPSLSRSGQKPTKLLPPTINMITSPPPRHNNLIQIVATVSF
ncbi:Mobile element protein (plasmid) [Sinorhizobium fredii CCBAU 83666]|nr:Mobile element protein [Sinorhizobium fredii CCBAU 83666]